MFTNLLRDLGSLSLRRESRTSRKNKRHSIPLQVETLERRELLTGTWTPLANLVPDPSGAQALHLLSDGTVMVQGGADSASKSWYRLRPDASGGYIHGTFSPLASMGLERLFFGSNVLPNGNLLVLGGEYTGSSTQATWTNTGEIYNPVANSWSAVANFPQSNFGDDPTVVLPNGKVLAGYISGPQTYLYDPTTNSWSQTGTKLRNDQSDEETWALLPDGSVLSYDIFSSPASGAGFAQRYVPATGTWLDAGSVPIALTNQASLGAELGPTLLLPDGRVFQLGANGNTALYTPSTNTWAVGPTIPNGKGCDDAPAAMLPNGHVIFLADTPLFQASTQMFDFDPVANTITQVDLPSTLASLLNSRPAFLERMVALPNGDILMSDSTKTLWEYTPDGAPNDAWRPTISGISSSNGTYTLTGTQFNGLSEGASYGDDAEMSTNYPIVQLTDANNHVYYARTFNWTPGVATGSTPVTVQFQLPAGLPHSLYSLRVIANGIASDPIPFGMSIPTAFVDHFEGSTLDPFWNYQYITSGSITYPSTAQAHSGQQSIQFNSTYNTGQKDIFLGHTFSQATYGKASVWVYDTGAGQSSGNYVELTISNQKRNQKAYVNAWDYDLGPNNGGNYVFGTPTINYQNSPIARTQGWHQFSIDSEPNSLQIAIDGTTVYTGTDSLPFDLVKIDTYGPTWRPAWTYYFDDFEFTPYPEFQVNTTTAGVQQFPSVAMNANGNSVVVWQSQGQNGDNGDIYAQRYDTAGNPLGGEIPVSIDTGTQEQPAVAMAPDGSFVVVWDGNGPGDSDGIFARRFGAAGNALGDEFLVNTYTSNIQVDHGIAMDAAGDFVIIWDSMGQDGDLWGMYGQRFHADGTRAGLEFQVNTTTGSNQDGNAVAMDATGNFIVLWQAQTGGTSPWHIYAQRYDANGDRLGGESTVTQMTSGNQFVDSVVMAANGHYAVAFEGSDGNGYGVFLRLFDALGNPLSGDIRVNTTTAGDQRDLKVALDSAGNILATWQSDGQDGSGMGVYGQRFAPNGVRRGGEFRINMTTSGDQAHPAVAMNAVGDAFVVWQGNGLGDDQGIFARQYVLPRVSVSDASVVEGNSGTTNMVFRVSLSAPSIWPVTVNYSTVAGTAKSGSDYKAVSGTITFLPGETLKNITVAVLGDTLYENNEKFSVKLSAPTNGVLSRSQGTGTIINDDPLPTLSIGDVTAAEPNGVTTTFTFTVTLSAPSGLTTTVNYATADDTALAGIDYVAKSGKLTFNPGVTTQTITITVKDDQLAEYNEDFYVLLSSPLNAALGKSKGTGTILES